jgi:hypothetical protein
VSPYEPGWLDALKAKHPYPGGWRDLKAAPSAERMEAWQCLVTKYRKREPKNISGSCNCYFWTKGPVEAWATRIPDTNTDRSVLEVRQAVEAVPNGRMDDFDIKAYRVKVTWPIPSADPVKYVQGEYVRSDAVKSEITVNGVKYATPKALYANLLGYATFASFVNSPSHVIKRITAYRNIYYYCVSDFKKAFNARRKRAKARGTKTTHI